MDKIIFVNAIEGDFEYDRTLDFKSAMKRNEISLGVSSSLLLSEAKDVVGVIFSMNLKCKKEVALQYSVILTFRVKGWSEEVDTDDTEGIKRLNEVGKMLEVAVGFLRGSMYVHTKNSPLDGFTVPLLELEELQKNLKVKKVEGQI